ncbi:hypothetical protein [Pseudomonas aeruginosa]|uniref:hypothetical protein n=1 Tax=Pseudomonas aeruginosa TaxID=287 RepID=UPI001154BFB7|nr:hypothetical protein [Pseudomonas aeruginosa]TQH44633.1 hypothetical protein FLI59_33700 [Pseudomonas aeruginosa]
MTTIKVQQKLGLAAFAILSDQLKAEGIHVINPVEGEVVTADDVVGKVLAAFNLGNKIEVNADVPASNKGVSYRFERIGGAYYLVRK